MLQLSFHKDFSPFNLDQDDHPMVTTVHDTGYDGQWIIQQQGINRGIADVNDLLRKTDVL